jgi:hypothetical protein
MVSVSTRDISRLCISTVLGAVLYRYWLVTPVLNYLSLDQWRLVAVGVAVLFGILSALGKWNLSTFVSGLMMGLMVGGTWAALPASHGSVGNAFISNLETFWREMIVCVCAAALGGYFCSLFPKFRRQL